jgi:hypothetical protein
MKGIGRWIIAAAAGIAATCLLGLVAQSHFALESLGAAVGPISLADRFTMIGADLVGLGPTYGTLVGGTLLVLFGAASLIARLAPATRVVVAALAGLIGVVAVVMGLEAVFGQPVLKGAASPVGLAAQAAAGLIGGLVFAIVSAPKRNGAA